MKRFVFLLALLAGCSGGRGSSALPTLPAATQAQVQVAIPQPAPGIIYYALGDSITNNPIDTTAFSFPAVLAQDMGMKMENVGVPGEDVQRLLATEVPKIDPATCGLVTLESGGPNLISFRQDASTVEPVFAQAYHNAFYRCPHGTVVIATYINNAEQPAVHQNIANYNEWLRAFAKHNHAPLADLDRDSRFNDPPFPSRNLYNWFHPNVLGMQQVAQDFEAVIK
jgi:lysophospholipase L1-like esterase